MSRRVPSWDLDDPSPYPPALLLHHEHHNHDLPSDGSAAAVPTPGKYEVAELTLKDGSLALLGLRQPRVGKPIPRYPGGTLECIVDQATEDAGRLSRPSSSPDILSLLGGPHLTAAAADALVPCGRREVESAERLAWKKRNRTGEFAGGRNCASQWSTATARRGSTLVMVDTCEMTGGSGTEELGLFSTSPSGSLQSAGEQEGDGGSPETQNRSFGGRKPSAVDDHESASHSLRSQGGGLREGGRSSISTKRCRAAAVHNQSERKRRDRINQKMKTLQRLVPNSSKTDKASMLDEVIEYMKLLQAQVHMMSMMSTIPHMMIPMAAMQHHQQQQQLQMLMMAHMPWMGMGMGMMDPTHLARPGPAGVAAAAAAAAAAPTPVFHPSAFFTLPVTAAAGSWDALAGDRMMQPAGGRARPDMFSASMSCAAEQPVSSEGYSMMAALYHQLYQQPLGSNQQKN